MPIDRVVVIALVMAVAGMFAVDCCTPAKLDSVSYVDTIVSESR